MEDLHKPAHVGTLVVMREVNIHVDGSNGVLNAVYFIKDDDRVFYVLDTYLVDLYFPIVIHALHICHFYLIVHMQRMPCLIPRPVFL